MVEIQKKEFAKLAGFIEANFGIHLKKEKEALLIGRLHNVLKEEGFQNFSEYYDHLVSGENEGSVIKLADQITTNHTFFMREPEHFYYFRDTVLPYLERTVKNQDIRTWCAACSTGEEAYTLAIILDEYRRSANINWDTKVLATDICVSALEKAQSGVYKTQSLSALPAYWKAGYFKKKDAQCSVVSENIKKEVIFRKLNLTDPVFPFKKKFHVIFCRNVMIYFTNKTTEELIDRFYDCMEFGGYLFVGHSESLNRQATRFRYIMPAVYRKE